MNRLHLNTSSFRQTATTMAVKKDGRQVGRFGVNRGIAVLSAVLLIAFASPQLQAQEHPKEHPQAAKGGTKEKSTLTTETLAKEITKYVQNESKLKGGYFLFYDESSKKPLALTLDKMHKDKLSKVEDGLYFACSDFKGTDGKTYDLDFFMRETNSGLQVTELTVHKEDGKARYVWVEQDGLWKRAEQK